MFEEGEIKKGDEKGTRFKKCQKQVRIYDNCTIKPPYQTIFYESSLKRLYLQAELEHRDVRMA